MQYRAILSFSTLCALSELSASCCAAKAKNRWPRSHPIRQADINQGTTLMTQTLPSMQTRRSSWSTACWRSLRCPRWWTSSALRSATARHLSDPMYSSPIRPGVPSLYRICFSFLQVMLSRRYDRSVNWNYSGVGTLLKREPSKSGENNDGCMISLFFIALLTTGGMDIYAACEIRGHAHFLRHNPPTSCTAGCVSGVLDN